MLTPVEPALWKRLAEHRHAVYSRMLGRSSFSLLEIGCGAGELGSEFVKLGVDFHGINIDQRVVESSRRVLPNRITHVDLFDFKPNKRFDAVCCHQVLEHITEPRRFAARILQLSSGTGILHGDVPNPDRLSSRLDSVIQLNPSRMKAIEMPHHQLAYEKASLQALFGNDYELSIFDAPVSDPTWGQAGRLGAAYRLYARLSRLLRSSGYLVFVGRRSKRPADAAVEGANHEDLVNTAGGRAM